MERERLAQLKGADVQLQEGREGVGGCQSLELNLYFMLLVFEG